jgi:hypothetical protein
VWCSQAGRPPTERLTSPLTWGLTTIQLPPRLLSLGKPMPQSTEKSSLNCLAKEQRPKLACGYCQIKCKLQYSLLFTDLLFTIYFTCTVEIRQPFIQFLFSYRFALAAEADNATGKGGVSAEVLQIVVGHQIRRLPCRERNHYCPPAVHFPCIVCLQPKLRFRRNANNQRRTQITLRFVSFQFFIHGEARILTCNRLHGVSPQASQM